MSSDFSGADYDADLDSERLTTQLDKVLNIMSDGEWRTLHEIAVKVGSDALPAPEASMSAQLRNLRKRKFGGHVIERTRVGTLRAGLFAYRLLVMDGHQGTLL